MMAISTSNPRNNYCKECGRDFDTLDHLNQRLYCGPCEKRRESEAKDMPTHARAKDCTSCGGFWKDCPICKTARDKSAKARRIIDFEKELTQLQKKIKEREAVIQLKLYEVILSGHKDYMIRKNTAIVILATSETHAREYAVATVINDPREIDLKVEIQEVTGPFENGHILSRRDF